MAQSKDYSDLYARVNRARALGKEELKNKALQAAGGTAAAVRGESAPEAFAKRGTDYSKRMMTPEQKLAKKMELLKYKEELDQYWYGEQQKRYLRELEQDMLNRRAILNAEEAKMRESGQAARARATARRLELGTSIKEDTDRGLSIIDPSKRLKESLKQVVPVSNLESLESRKAKAAKRLAKQAKSSAGLLKVQQDAEKKGWRKDEQTLEAWVDNQAEQRYKREKALARGSVLRAAKSLFESGDRNDIVNGMPILSKMADTGTEQLLSKLGKDAPTVYMDLRNNQMQEMDEIQRGIEMKQVERAKASARTYGSSGGVGEAQKLLMSRPATSMPTQQALPTQQPGVLPQDLDGDTGGMTETQEQQTKPNFMGVPGVSIPETSQQRVLEMFNIIEKYPEHTPAKQAKMDIMASDELAQYAKQFGADAPKDKVYKELVRDARLKAKEVNKTFNKKRAEKRLAEVKSRFAKIQKPSVPVTGSDRGLGEEDVNV